MAKIRRMRQLALQCDLPEGDIEYMEYTFGILALAREYFFRPFDERIRNELIAAKKAYKKRYPRNTRVRYTVALDFNRTKINNRFIAWSLKYLVRQAPAYRFGEKIVGMRLLSFAYFFLKRSRPKMIPKLARKSAMGIDAIFK